jgi:hypothetical protein
MTENAKQKTGAARRTSRTVASATVSPFHGAFQCSETRNAKRARRRISRCLVYENKPADIPVTLRTSGTVRVKVCYQMAKRRWPSAAEHIGCVAVQASCLARSSGNGVAANRRTSGSIS